MFAGVVRVNTRYSDPGWLNKVQIVSVLLSSSDIMLDIIATARDHERSGLHCQNNNFEIVSLYLAHTANTKLGYFNHKTMKRSSFFEGVIFS